MIIMTIFVKRQSVYRLKQPDFLKNVENTLTNGVLFPEKYYLCKADRCVRMQPLAEKCFSLNLVAGRNRQIKSNSSLKVLGISTPLFCITEGITYVHSIYITVRAFFLPSSAVNLGVWRYLPIRGEDGIEPRTFSYP